MEATFVGEASDVGRAAYSVDTDGTFLAFAESGASTVAVAYLRNLAAPTLMLETHLQCKPITAVCLGQGAVGSSDPAPAAAARGGLPQQALLLVASQDAVVLWQLAAAFAAAAEGQELPEPVLLMSRQGQVDALAVSPTAAAAGQLQQQLVVCAGPDVHVFELQSLRNTHRLEGHHAAVLCAAFCAPHSSHTLVTAGEDRTFKVWDLKEGVMLYQSSILTASPLTSVAVDPSYARIALGASDGVVRFFDLASLPACRFLQAVDVSKQLQKITDRAADIVAAARAGSADGPVVVTASSGRRGSSQQGQQQVGDGEEDGDDAVAVVAGGASVLRLFYSPSFALPDGDTLLGESPKLLVGTTKALAVIDTHTYEVDEGHFLRGGSGNEMATASYLKQASKARQAVAPSGPAERQLAQFHFLPECSQAGAYAFAVDPYAARLPGQQRQQQQQQGPGAAITCCVSAAFEPLISVFTLRPAATFAGKGPPSTAQPGGYEEEREPQGSSSGVSVFMTQPHSQDSLRSSSSSAASTSLPDATAATTGRSSSSGRGGGACLPTPGGSSGSSGAGKRNSSPGSTSKSAPPGAVGGLARTRSTGSSGAASSSAASVAASSSSSSSASKAKAAVANQPVTFHRKIKSSGYGFVQPQVRMGCAPPSPVKVSKTGASSGVVKNLLQQRQYPVDCGPLVQRQEKNVLPGNAPVHGSAILRVAYSSDASRILTASADRTSRVMKLPMHKARGTDLIAHNAAVLSASWSHDGTMVLTASADRTARMWNAGFAQPLLEFTHVAQQVSPLASALPPLSPAPSSSAGRAAAAAAAAAAASDAGAAANKPFVHEVRACQFFHMDQFVLLATGNKLHLYRYKLNDSASDDLERLRNLNKYRLAASYASPSQTINALSAYNSFLSPIALIAGSNRSIEVVDVSTMQRVAAVEDAHVRPPHALVQSVESLYVSHGKDAYELFATASQDNTVKLWDVRTARCVRTFSGHKNSSVATGIAFSPCLRYLASGSEDKAAYLYDLRTGSVLHKTRGVHGDAVMDCAFNPLHPQLATACLDGRLHFYSDVL